VEKRSIASLGFFSVTKNNELFKLVEAMKWPKRGDTTLDDEFSP
jgi:hypothetical protein